MSENDQTGHVEITYIDDEDNARKTGLGAAGVDYEETKQCFEFAKHLAVPIETEAKFLCDLHHPEKGIVETVGLTHESVRQITGKRTLTDAEYIQYDKQYWRERGANTP